MSVIVVIDAEPVVRSTVAKILESGGHSVQAAADFHKGRDLIRSSRPALVITNVFLPGITGHDAMLELRKEFPSLQVLMVSGLPDDPAIQHWMTQKGFDAFPKPFSAESLLVKVRESLEAEAGDNRKEKTSHGAVL